MMYLLLVLAGIVAWAVITYNNFIKLVNRVREAWAEIDVQLKRRYDLVANLVSTAKGSGNHDGAAFDNVSAARSSAMDATDADEKGKAENALSSSLRAFFAVAEAYPDLKTNTAFAELKRELSDAEVRMQALRGFYNGSVMALNTSIDLFPSNLIANVFHFNKAELFSLAEMDVPVKKSAEEKA